MISRFVAALLGVSLLYGCALDRPQYDAVPTAALLSAKSGPHNALQAFKQSCGTKMPPEFAFACEQALALEEGDSEQLAYNYFVTHFDAYMVTRPDSPTGFVTGYYEPELEGSLRKTATYRYPLYAAPERRITPETPFATRRDIEDKQLLKGREVLWLKDDIERFFLHIQGSGKVRLPDGSRITAQYAAKNHQPYTPIGRILVARGEIAPEDVSMQSIKAWLRANPEKAQAVMWENDTYVFFKTNNSTAPAKGAQGIALLAESSIAIDRAFAPYGVPVFIDTKLADGSPYRRLLIAQDTGGAIKGPMRGDIYFGQGEPAAAKAGGLRSQANWFILWPKGSAPHAATAQR